MLFEAADTAGPPAVAEAVAPVILAANAAESLVDGEWVSFAGGADANAAIACSGDRGLFEGEAAAICCDCSMGLSWSWATVLFDSGRQ